MTDKNGIEIRTGAIVEITGAYFKRDNGLYFVDKSPEDLGWSGSDCCLKKISKSGKISTAKYNISFWPIMVTVNGPKYYEAKRWNAENAAIEVKPPLANMAEVAAHFREEAATFAASAERLASYQGEEAAAVQLQRCIAQHYEDVAKMIEA